MCGICGIAFSDRDRPIPEDRITRMRETIAHRGPDGVGLRQWPGVALAQTRLAIIDVAGGWQPLANEDESVWITFNGEIYNYQEIGERLLRAGHRFRTRSDTEVLVHAYEEYGPEFVRDVNGIFAFAMYDLRKRRLLLARDHVGVKPMFYTVTPEGLFFGSEIKAVMQGAQLQARLRPESLAEYMTFRYVAGANSFYDGVKRLPPGHIAIWEDGRLRIQEYWSPANLTNGRKYSLPTAVEELDTRLGRAVEGQMMSEVPLGTFCSGGVDSGLITGYASGFSPHQLKTFSVGFREPKWDETPLAKDTAARFRTDHHTVIAEPDQFASLLPGLIRSFDEPLSHPNSVPLYLLSGFARRQVTVVLTGEGSDEIFGGYPRYQIARLRRALRYSPTVALRLTASLAALGNHRGRLLAELLPLSIEDGIIFNSRYVDPALISQLVGIPVGDVLQERRDALRRTLDPDDALTTISRFEALTYLGSLLDRIDRMSMAHGLEARVPFLDLPLLTWALSLSSSMKIRGTRNKLVPKALARRTLSPRITDGPKSGFGVPLGDWFRLPGFRSLLQRLRNTNHAAAEHFDVALVDRLVTEHLAGRVDHGQVLWLLANVYLWHEVHVENNAIPAHDFALVGS